MYFSELCKLFSKLPEVDALALCGSRAQENYDSKSDYDLCIYCSCIPNEDVRRTILEKTCSYMEMSNSYWEFEDDCTLKDGIDIDLIYRNLNDYRNTVSYVVDGCNSYNGYTTCMWHTLINSKIIFDRNGEFEKLQKEYKREYPEKLKNNIIERNMKLLSGFLPSYEGQINKAVSRSDLVSVCHRTAAFMESYFDIIFALNKLTHPGEKRMVEYALKNAKTLPKDFSENIEQLYKHMYSDKQKFIQILKTMVLQLKDIL